MEPSTVTPESPGLAERNWLPLAIAALVVVALVAALLLTTGHKRPAAPLSGTPDPYAANLLLTHLAMSESSNLAGGKVTYLDGQIANHGSSVVTAVTVEVTFRDFARKVAEREAMPLMLVRMREPYIDTENVAAAPLKPGADQEFRLNFDQVSPDWAGELPEVRILQVKTR